MRKENYKNEKGQLGIKGILLRDRLLRRGLSATQVARKLRVNRWAIGFYLDKHPEVKQRWEESRRNYLGSKNSLEEISVEQGQEENEKNNLISGMIAGVIQSKLNPEDVWAYEKALEAKKSGKCEYSFGFLFDVYKDYDEAEKNGGISFNELARRNNVYVSAMSRIMEKIGIKSNWTSKKPIRVSQYQREALQRGFDRKMSFADLGYFVGVRDYVAWKQYYKNPNGRKVGEEDWFFEDFGVDGKLTKRLASKIYKMQDNGRSPEVIIRQLGINPRLYDVAMQGRDVLINGRVLSFEDELVEDLRAIYPDRKINRPYRDFGLNGKGKKK